MQLNQFKFLIAVDQYGSISKAAQELYISQSTVSLALINLEEELGVTILNRGKRGVSFTAEGKLVLEKAKAIMNEVDELSAITFDATELIGEVRVGGSSHFCMNIITDMMIQMKRQYPLVCVSTKRQNVKDIVKAVAQKELDLGYINFNTLNETDVQTELRRYFLEFVPIFQAKQCICVSERHPLYGKKNIPFAELLPYDLVSLAFKMDEFMYQYFKKQGYTKEPVSINDIANLRKYAMAVDALMLMPNKEIESSNRTYTDQFYKLDVPEFDITVTAGLIYRTDYIMTSVENKVIELLERESWRYQDANE